MPAVRHHLVNMRMLWWLGTRSQSMVVTPSRAPPQSHTFLASPYQQSWPEQSADSTCSWMTLALSQHTNNMQDLVLANDACFKCSLNNLIVRHSGCSVAAQGSPNRHELCLIGSFSALCPCFVAFAKFACRRSLFLWGNTCHCRIGDALILVITCSIRELAYLFASPNT